MEHIDIRVSKELKTAIEAAAKADRRNVSEWARITLERAIDWADAPIPFKVAKVAPVSLAPLVPPEERKALAEKVIKQFDAQVAAASAERPAVPTDKCEKCPHQKSFHTLKGMGCNIRSCNCGGWRGPEPVQSEPPRKPAWGGKPKGG